MSIPRHPSCRPFGTQPDSETMRQIARGIPADDLDATLADLRRQRAETQCYSDAFIPEYPDDPHEWLDRVGDRMHVASGVVLACLFVGVFIMIVAAITDPEWLAEVLR